MTLSLQEQRAMKLTAPYTQQGPGKYTLLHLHMDMLVNKNLPSIGRFLFTLV